MHQVSLSRMENRGQRAETGGPAGASCRAESLISGEEGSSMSSLITFHSRCRSCSASFSHPPTTSASFSQGVGGAARRPQEHGPRTPGFEPWPWAALKSTGSWRRVHRSALPARTTCRQSASFRLAQAVTAAAAVIARHAGNTAIPSDLYGSRISLSLFRDPHVAFRISASSQVTQDSSKNGDQPI